MPQDFIRFQADHHPRVQTDRFESMEEYCLHLIHLKAYEEAARIGRGKVVLDLGCNNGYGTRIIASVGQRVMGVDVSETSIAEARRVGHESNLLFQRVNGDRLPFGDAEFDVVASFQVIEHVSDYQPYLSEINRVLKKGGMVLFTTPNARIRLDPGMKPWFPFHVREFSAAELDELLRKWFPIVQVKGLFAIKELYEVEYARVQRSRMQKRRRDRAIFPPYLEIKARVIDVAKAILPSELVKSVQSIVRKHAARRDNMEKLPTSANTVIAPEILGRYSTVDLHYSDENLDESLDLMAICQKT